MKQLPLFPPVLTCYFGSIWWVECGPKPCAKCAACNGEDVK